MNKKRFIKIFSFILGMMMLLFAQKVSAAEASASIKNEEIVWVQLGNENYSKPNEEEIDLTNCSNCTVEINHNIDINELGTYDVSYTIKQDDTIIQTLNKHYVVINTNPAQYGKDTTPVIPVGSGNTDFNLLLMDMDMILVVHQIMAKLELKCLLEILPRKMGNQEFQLHYVDYVVQIGMLLLHLNVIVKNLTK